MSARIFVMYPQPTDVEKFESDYAEHLEVYAEHLPDAPTPVVSRTKSAPDNPAPFYMIVNIGFDSMDDLKVVLKSEGMQTVGGHANQISSGGAPTILIAEDS